MGVPPLLFLRLSAFGFGAAASLRATPPLAQNCEGCVGEKFAGKSSQLFILALKDDLRGLMAFENEVWETAKAASFRLVQDRRDGICAGVAVLWGTRAEQGNRT